MEMVKVNGIPTLILYICIMFLFIVSKKTVSTNEINKCVCCKIMEAKCLNKGRVWGRNE